MFKKPTILECYSPIYLFAWKVEIMALKVANGAWTCWFKFIILWKFNILFSLHKRGKKNDNQYIYAVWFQLLLYLTHVYVALKMLLQIRDCRTRYNGDADQQSRRKKFSFPARLICADCYEVIGRISETNVTV